MSGLDLAAVVDYFASRVDQRLTEVQSGVINLGEPKRNVAWRDQQGYVKVLTDPYILLSRAARRMRLNSSESMASEFSR